MASTSKIQNSSIAMALAGKSASVEIPKPRDPGDRIVAAKDAPGKKQHGSLPTPPNSISPSLPPNAFNKAAREHSAPLTPPGNGGDSDIDLQDAVEHAAAQDQSGRGLAASGLKSLDTAGAITPRLLAAYHLPEILLGQEPLAIRHIMGHLTTTVPGFSRIPSAKARRLVVSALEGRGGAGGEAAGGVSGDVIFEKVGWGRWTAREQGNSKSVKRHLSPIATRHLSGSHGAVRSPSPYATHGKQLRIPHRPARPGVQRGRMPSYNSAAHSYQSQDLLPSREETDADRMSLDELDNSDLSGSDPDDGDMGEETDEEDWAGIGAAALRAGSFPKIQKPKKWIDYNARAAKEAERRRRAVVHRSPLLVAKSAPTSAEAMEQHRKAQEKAWAELKIGGQQSNMREVDKDDAEAIAALLQLGSH